MKLAVSVLAILLAWVGLAHAQTPTSPTAEQCERFHRALDLPEFRESSDRWWVEGTLRYQGRCYPQDKLAGIALLDRAVRMDHARAAVDMAIYAAADGTAEAAATWRLMATLAVYVRRDAPSSERIGLDDLPVWLANDVAGLKWAFEREDIPALLARVRWLLARPPYMPETEWRFVAEVTEFAMARESFEAFHLFAIAAIEWAGPETIDRNLRGLGFMTLRAAAACGYPDAIRKQAEYLADGRLPDHLDTGVVARLRWLHDQTGREGELLRRLDPEGRPMIPPMGEDLAELNLRLSSETCRSAIRVRRR